MVMVLGEVEKPGPVMLKRGLNLVDALMRAGGYTKDADLHKVYILRHNGDNNDKGDIRQVDLKTMLETGDFSHNFSLAQDDIIYVGPTGMRKFNYAMEQLLPSLSVLSMSTGIMDNLGLTDRVFQLQP
jgi:polysaccharide export outer membrane protein